MRITRIRQSKRYDFYKLEEHDRVYWNIVPTGSNVPVGWYSSKEHIEAIKHETFANKEHASR